MMRILHTIDTTGPGGAETVFLNLIKGLNRDKFESVAAIRGPGWVCNELEKIGMNPLFISTKGSFNYKYVRELVSIIRRERIDIIQSHLLGSNLYCSFAGLICGVPVISTFHGFVDIHAKERLSALKSMIINKGSGTLVFVSDAVRKFYVEKKGYSGRKAVTIHNGVDLSLFKPKRDNTIRNRLGLRPENVLVGAVGNIRPAKGYEYLLQAAKLVVERFPQFRFVVAGEGSGRFYEGILELRKRLGLQNHLAFVGFERDVPKFFNNLDLFVLPSVSEGFSISTIEAMASGVPVIATRSGGPEEIITHMRNGILVETRNPESLSKEIIQLAGNDSLKTQFVNKSRNDVISRYSIEAVTNSYKEIYYSS